MTVHPTPLEGVLLLEPPIYRDDRGYFQEIYHQEKYAERGIPDRFVQANRSFSKKGVLRGLHFQNPDPQGKLVCVCYGAIFDVAVDIRPASPTFRQWHGETLTSENGRQLWIPVGFAHGFVALEDSVVEYHVTAPYNPQGDASVRFDDPSIGIGWPISRPVLSGKDQDAPLLQDLPAIRLSF